MIQRLLIVLIGILIFVFFFYAIDVYKEPVRGPTFGYERVR